MGASPTSSSLYVDTLFTQIASVPNIEKNSSKFLGATLRLDENDEESREESWSCDESGSCENGASLSHSQLELGDEGGCEEDLKSLHSPDIDELIELALHSTSAYSRVMDVEDCAILTEGDLIALRRRLVLSFHY